MITCPDCEIYELDEAGRIRTPGRFEGEPAYVVHYYHFMLANHGVPCMCGAVYFLVTDEDARYYPELAPWVGKYAHISDLPGPVHIKLYTLHQLDLHENRVALLGDDTAVEQHAQTADARRFDSKALVEGSEMSAVAFVTRDLLAAGELIDYVCPLCVSETEYEDAEHTEISWPDYDVHCCRCGRLINIGHWSRF